MKRDHLVKHLLQLEIVATLLLAGAAATFLSADLLYQVPLAQMARPVFTIGMSALFIQAALTILKHLLKSRGERGMFPAHQLLIATLATAAVTLSYLPH